ASTSQYSRSRRMAPGKPWPILTTRTLRQRLRPRSNSAESNRAILALDITMNDIQLLTIALTSVPTVVTVLIGILLNNWRLNDTNARIADFRAHADARFSEVDRRFDDMRDTWRSELRRVEEVLDARLKHPEELIDH